MDNKKPFLYLAIWVAIPALLFVLFVVVYWVSAQGTVPAYLTGPFHLLLWILALLLPASFVNLVVFMWRFIIPTPELFDLGTKDIVERDIFRTYLGQRQNTTHPGNGATLHHRNDGGVEIDNTIPYATAFQTNQYQDGEKP